MWESLSSTLIHSPLKWKHSQPEYITHDPSLVLPFTHLYGTCFPEITIRRKTFNTGSNCTRPKPKTIGSDTTCWDNLMGKHWGDLTRMRQEPIHIRKWHHLQPKTLRLCGSSFLYIAQLSHSYPMWDLDSHLNT